jgi:hypothetical protein
LRRRAAARRRPNSSISIPITQLAYSLTSKGLAIEIDNRAGKREQNTRIDHLQKMRDRCRRRGKPIEFSREDGTFHWHWEPSRRWTKLNATLQR